jgi:hypothetical protein
LQAPTPEDAKSLEVIDVGEIRDGVSVPT